MTDNRVLGKLWTVYTLTYYITFTNVVKHLTYKSPHLFSGSQLKVACVINFDFKKYIEKVRGYTVVFIRLSLVAGDSE